MDWEFGQIIREINILDSGEIANQKDMVYLHRGMEASMKESGKAISSMELDKKYFPMGILIQEPILKVCSMGKESTSGKMGVGMKDNFYLEREKERER